MASSSGTGANSSLLNLSTGSEDHAGMIYGAFTRAPPPAQPPAVSLQANMNPGDEPPTPVARRPMTSPVRRPARRHDMDHGPVMAMT